MHLTFRIHPAQPDALEEWRRTLKVGQKLDAMDADLQWLPARVVDFHGDNKKVELPPPDSRDGFLMIHFEGWASRFDEPKHLQNNAHELAPRYSVTKNWRAHLKIGDPIGTFGTG